MKEDLKCIMLIDDNPDDNFFHEREIKKCNASLNVITKMSGLEALEYLKSMKIPFPRHWIFTIIKILLYSIHSFA